MSTPGLCSRCVLQGSTPDIKFDEHGQCNYCRDFEALIAAAPDCAERDRRGKELIAKIRRSGRGKRYDCVVGVSGGVDSSYVLYLAVKCGLRPLAVHLDNGWNSELAVHNIATLLRKMDVNLFTHVIRWEENRDLQRAFMAAHVIDIEMLMDSAMTATLYRAARQFDVKFILSGSNNATEGIAMPIGWSHHKWDARNARAIHRRHGTRPVPSHPFYSLWSMLLDRYIRRIELIAFLDFFDYQKEEAVSLLQQEVGYKPYPYKHYESVFTRFYQAEILPRKFGVDKRRVHLSALVISGQMSREEALAMLDTPTYPDPGQLRDDRDFVAKKLGFSLDELDAYLNAPPVAHSTFQSDESLLRAMSRIKRQLIRIARI